MSNPKRYTWTVSVIAMLDRDEMIDNKIVQLEAYEEFERSITTLKPINKDINFLVYLYDVKDLTAYVKKIKVFDNELCLEVVKITKELDFHEKGFKHLVSFFSEYVAKTSIEENEVHKHILITWGHGNGVGFFSKKEKKEIRDLFNLNDESTDVVESYQKVIKSLRFLRSQLDLTDDQIVFNKHANSTNPFFKSASAIDYFNYAKASALKCISAKELSEIITAGFAGDISLPKKGQIDYLLCLTCYTQMIETGFSLRNAVRVMIAPETTISFFGYDYKKLFELLLGNPHLANDRTIANSLVNCYLNKYQAEFFTSKIDREVLYKIEYRRLVSFSMIRLQSYDRVVEAVAELVRFLLCGNNKVNIFDEIPFSVMNAFIEARKRCMETSFQTDTDSGVVDFNNLFLEFCRLYTVSEFEKIEQLAAQIISSYDDPGELIVAQYNPGHYSSFKFDKQVVSLNAGTFGIFLPRGFPAEGPQLNVFNLITFDNVNPESFWGKTNWNLLLKKQKA